jgi:hypothetical protein
MTSVVSHLPPLNGNKNHDSRKDMKKKFLLCFTCLSFFSFTNAIGQNDVPKYKVAIFAPLYLDSAYDESNKYRYSKNIFPKFINPGLELYEGAKLALDSLNIQKAPLEVFVYDTRSAKENLSQQLSRPELANVSLIITHCTSTEVKLFADAGLKRNTPVINVNMPNDGGVTGNPFFIMLNPTLRTQCEGIYRHLQKFYSLNPIVIFRRKGQLEDRIKMYMDDFSKATVAIPLKYKIVELTDSFTVNHLKPYLDTTNQTLCLAGSLDENFGKRLVRQLAVLKKQKYQSVIMGMPTWDNIKEFNKPEYKGIEIIYSTPFYNAKMDKISQRITAYFKDVMFARPSDMVFRGYEVTWKYVKILMEYKTDFASNITSKLHKVFTDYDIQPVLNKQTMTLDYFENKKLYFLKWQDGILKAVY